MTTQQDFEKLALELNFEKLALELAEWSQECAIFGRNQWAPRGDIDALYAKTNTTWVVVFCDGNGEYEVGLSQVAFMGSISARQDQIMRVYPNNQQEGRE